jgi:hypothetical protein
MVVLDHLLQLDQEDQEEVLVIQLVVHHQELMLVHQEHLDKVMQGEVLNLVDQVLTQQLEVEVEQVLLEQMLQLQALVEVVLVVMVQLLQLQVLQ